MRIAVFGCGYVGLVTAACLAETGNRVIGVDVNPNRVGELNRGVIPIFEPGLEPLLEVSLKNRQLAFSADGASAIRDSDVIFIAVGTPSADNGDADLTAVMEVARLIGRHTDCFKTVVVKSTVPVGTCARVGEAVAGEAGPRAEFAVASNPEFLKEGAAVGDFKHPDRIIIGVDDERAEQVLRELYAPFNRNHDKLIVMDVRSSELTKYAANAMLATRISFMNELAHIAARAGADIEQVRIGIGSDPRIGYSFIYPGVGFGGACFPKDLRALEHTARSLDYDARLIRAVDGVNRAQRQYLPDLIRGHFDGQLAGKTIALWGLAFKPNTDDMREAPSRILMEALWAEGAKVRAHDPEAMPEARRLYPDRNDVLALCDDPYDALDGADALAVVTEWRCYWSPDYERIRDRLSQAVIFDGRNIYDPERLRGAGFIHYSVGRPQPPGHRERKLA